MTLAIRWILYRYLPAQKKAIALATGKFLQQQITGSSLLAEKLAGQDTINGILPMIETEIDEFLRVRLKASMPVVGMFIGEKTIGQLKAVFMEELVRLFPRIMSQLANQIPQKLNLSELMLEKMEALAPEQWKQILQTTIGPASRRLAILGALLGLLISCFTLGLAAVLQ